MMLSVWAIHMYRLFVSPVLRVMGVQCRYEPSCSNYAQTALQRFSFAKACKLTFRRVLRCNPRFPGGYDPVPAGDMSK